MAPKRFFIEQIGDTAELTGEEFRHAKTVLRLKAGDEVTLFDGSGTEYAAIVSEVLRDRIVLTAVGARGEGRDPKADILLLVGALKGDKTELVVQKATELGVSHVVVFSSRYAAAYMNDNKLERLRRVAREAAKQCYRATVPQVDYAETLEEGLKTAKRYQNKLFACEFLETGERGVEGIEGDCALVVGSEGGFTREEYALAKEYGFAGVSLGRRILRAETAAIALTALAAHALGEI